MADCLQQIYKNLFLLRFKHAYLLIQIPYALLQSNMAKILFRNQQIQSKIFFMLYLLTTNQYQQQQTHLKLSQAAQSNSQTSQNIVSRIIHIPFIQFSQPVSCLYHINLTLSQLQYLIKYRNKSMKSMKHQQYEEQQELSGIFNSDRSPVKQQQLSQFENDDQPVAFVKHKSKMIILYDGSFNISLGPHYYGFLLGFMMLVCAGFAVLLFVSHTISSYTHQIIGKALYFISISFYMMTAFMNPGIYNAADNIQPKTKYCHTCMHFKPKNVHHCLKCDICIEGYDHHCPWISKCIGKGNIIFFYTFIVSLSCFSLYMYYSFYLGLWANNKTI